MQQLNVTRKFTLNDVKRSVSLLSTMQKLINSPESCVDEAIRGVLLSDSRVLRIEGFSVLVREDIHQVGLVIASQTREEKITSMSPWEGGVCVPAELEFIA